MCNEFLGQNGHSQIAMITGMMESYSSQCRLDAYQTLSGISKALLQAGICCQRQLQLEERMPVGETINESA